MKYSSYDEIPEKSDVLHPSVGFAAVRSVDSFTLEEGKYIPASTDDNGVELPDLLSGRAHLFKKAGKTHRAYPFSGRRGAYVLSYSRIHPGRARS